MIVHFVNMIIIKMQILQDCQLLLYNTCTLHHFILTFLLIGGFNLAIIVYMSLVLVCTLMIGRFNIRREREVTTLILFYTFCREKFLSYVPFQLLFAN